MEKTNADKSGSLVHQFLTWAVIISVFVGLGMTTLLLEIMFFGLYRGWL